MNRLKMAGCLACFFMAGLHATFAQNLIVNGSFESTNNFVPDGNRLMSLPAGSTAMPGWVVIEAEIAWAPDSNPFVRRAADGTFFLDLTGYHDSKPFGGIRQVITTELGELYLLSFEMGVDQNYAPYAGPIEIEVRAGGITNSFVYHPTNLPPAVHWGRQEMLFRGTGTSNLVEFVGRQGIAYVGLDNIRVERAAPSLSIRKEGNHVILSWGRLYQGFFLESSDSLTPPRWNRVPGTPVEGIDEFVIAVPISREQEYFRLSRP